MPISKVLVLHGSSCRCILTKETGAVVLAHSLRENGTTAKLAVLYTPETLQVETIAQLEVLTSPSLHQKLNCVRTE